MALQSPEIDDIPHQKNALRLVVTEKIEQPSCLAGTCSEMDIREKDGSNRWHGAHGAVPMLRRCVGGMTLVLQRKEMQLANKIATGASVTHESTIAVTCATGWHHPATAAALSATRQHF
ncbi:hypothetical protein [uncultured Propionivibrio sp.]|uniref:hypothetical protein n=1 Tax=uncultured Propionivibrio sp. TaxID=426737 RepID=UPI0029C01F6E|nr:hypothetical protein [uncultured Propionivibrio sp.]